MTIDRICIKCGKLFKARPSVVNKGGGKFCSYKCGGAWRSKYMSGDNSPTKNVKWDDDRKERFKSQYVMPPSRKGIKSSASHKKKLSDAHLGLIPWNKNKILPPLSENHKKKIGDSLREDYKLQRGVKGGKKAPAFRRGDELPPF